MPAPETSRPGSAPPGWSVPQRVILSRKGFDSGAGGIASPILPDGTPFSLPIPDFRSRHRFDDLRHGEVRIGHVVEQLSRGRISGKHWTHLDPDLIPGIVEREHGFRAAFGQTGAAATHLVGENVGAGDPFLFFGWFRETALTADGNHVWKRGAPDLHLIFGWLRIGEVLPISTGKKDILHSYPELAHHPHLYRPSIGGNADPRNTLYLASDRLAIPGLPDLPGYGTFASASTGRTLTKPGARRSTWSMPGWMQPGNGVRFSYHDDPGRWSGDTLRAAARGQEFVLSGAREAELLGWLGGIFASSQE